jgi:hypothetical protein
MTPPETEPCRLKGGCLFQHVCGAICWARLSERVTG